MESGCVFYFGLFCVGIFACGLWTYLCKTALYTNSILFSHKKPIIWIIANQVDTFQRTRLLNGQAFWLGGGGGLVLKKPN